MGTQCVWTSYLINEYITECRVNMALVSEYTVVFVCVNALHSVCKDRPECHFTVRPSVPPLQCICGIALVKTPENNRKPVVLSLIFNKHIQ